MTDRVAASIAEILAHARAGAHERAWALFAEAGLAARRDSVAALTLHGRLLKDRGRNAQGEARRREYLAAAAAYAEAAALSGSTYPRINAATLSLLAGQEDQARRLAGETLALLDPPGDQPETPYFLAATRAEALLLLGREADARAALAEAIAAAPNAWEDHATTLRQFGLILAELGAPSEWLDRFRPPRSAHFAGGMRMPEPEDALRAAIMAWIAEERIGFGYGALAAGADILIGEALVAAGAELHVVLPAPCAAFVAASVRPFGAGWQVRFDALIAAAASVREIETRTDAADPAALGLADDVAMGRAAINARALESEALQLVVDRADSGMASNSERVWRRWQAAGRRQHRIVPAAVESDDAAEYHGSDHAIAAMLAIRIAAPTDRALQALAAILAERPPIAPPAWIDTTLLLRYPDASQAARAAIAIAPCLAAARPWRMAAHLGIAQPCDDPVTGATVYFGDAAAVALRILSAAPDETALASDLFAASLAVEAPGGAEPVGELDGGREPMPLFSLRL
jgi:hypothetical protein